MMWCAKTVILVASVVFITAAPAAEEPRKWMLFPDGDGKLHVIYLDEEAPVAPAAARLAAANPATFQLYTKSNPSTYTELVPNDANSLANFDKSLPTRLIIHGWTSSGSNMEFIKNAYLSAGSYNVIIVDWSDLASALYTAAKGSVATVGAYVATLLDFLASQGVSLSNVHIAGHSLGAHVAGVAGNRVSGTLGKITGLDPAAPLFGTESLENRLDESDAAFVEVIHTCAGLLGWADPMGHADFYPNGGTSIQPGCGLDIGGACSHGRSHDYFSESITTSVGFYSHQCSSWSTFQGGSCDSNPSALMGEYTDTSASGSYYLTTASSSPYALGQ